MRRQLALNSSSQISTQGRQNLTAANSIRDGAGNISNGTGNLIAILIGIHGSAPSGECFLVKRSPACRRRRVQKGSTAMGKRTVMLALMAMAAVTLASGDDRYDRRSRDRQSGIYGRVADPVDRSLRDVQYVWSRSRVDGHERDHFRKVMDSLQRFQDRAARGRFDRGQLDRAIDNLEHLAQAGQIHPQGRQLLRQRLYDLRSFREDGRYW